MLGFCDENVVIFGVGFIFNFVYVGVIFVIGDLYKRICMLMNLIVFFLNFFGVVLLKKI